jgi:hypothetical protein
MTLPDIDALLCSMAWEGWLMWGYIWFGVGVIVSITIFAFGRAIYATRGEK